VRLIRVIIPTAPQECVMVEQRIHNAWCETKAKRTEVVTEERPTSVRNVG